MVPTANHRPTGPEGLHTTGCSSIPVTLSGRTVGLYGTVDTVFVRFMGRTRRNRVGSSGTYRFTGLVTVRAGLRPGGCVGPPSSGSRVIRPGRPSKGTGS